MGPYCPTGLWPTVEWWRWHHPLTSWDDRRTAEGPEMGQQGLAFPPDEFLKVLYVDGCKYNGVVVIELGH